MTTNEQNIKSRTVLSVLSLFFQSGYSAFLGLIANLILTILLSPTIFGIYITVLSIIALLNYFSDIGLAASLIQKKEISEEDLKTTFTTQQIIILILIAVGFASTSFIQSFYLLPIEGVYLFWGLLVSFFISSLKTIPSILLERKIQFQKIVLVQIIENTVFYLSAIVLALLGFGLMSFTLAVLFRAISGLIIIYTLSFWLPKVGISIASLKNLLSF
ncbi:oligosaccharide flippase family protein, partial [Candidatus Roizmanbacteria bacterium]|nr:oligosaccharide flippase family protein [Candidatus Roizmanbacteria bacterium]